MISVGENGVGDMREQDGQTESGRKEVVISIPSDDNADASDTDCPCLIPIYLSYDCNCQYAAKILQRFMERFPELVKRIKKMDFCIPAVHIRDHKESCEYRYGSFYTEGGCHFHGEQAESIWAEFNQLGARTRQMSPGHRHDVLNDHLGDWNWQKTSSMCEHSIITTYRSQLTKRLTLSRTACQ